MKPRIIVVDYRPAVLEGLTRMLSNVGTVVGHGESSREVVDKLKENTVDVVIFGLSIPESNCLGALGLLARKLPSVRAVVYTHRSDNDYVWMALKAGVSGYILDTTSQAELEHAIRAIISGEMYLSRTISKKFAGCRGLAQTFNPNSPLDRLSARQKEILALIGDGVNTKTIASVLNINPKTIEYHRLKINSILGTTTQRLPVEAIRLGLTTLEEP